MPRQRFIWPTIWTDPVLGRLKETELLLYIGCFSIADDEGKLLGDATYLRATIFPYSNVGATRMRRVRDSVVSKVSSLEMYVVDGVEYLRFPGWKKWQKPKYPSPSQYPDPGPDSGNGSGNDSPEVDPTPEKPSGNVSPTGWVGLGRDGLGRKGAKAPSSANTPTEVEQTVYAKWRSTFNKAGKRYDKITDKRLWAIRKALKHSTSGELCLALDGIQFETPQWWIDHHEPWVVFRNQERVEHLLELEERKPVAVTTNGQRAGMSPAEIIAYTKGRA